MHIGKHLSMLTKKRTTCLLGWHTRLLQRYNVLHGPNLFGHTNGVVGPAPSVGCIGQRHLRKNKKEVNRLKIKRLKL